LDGCPAYGHGDETRCGPRRSQALVDEAAVHLVVRVVEDDGATRRRVIRVEGLVQERRAFLPVWPAETRMR
jgi:hypothetical protein